jgi:hypothetical protein
MKTDHPDLHDLWLEATMHSSREHVVQISVGHCCMMKEKEVKQSMTSLLPCADPFLAEAFLAGATHYYQHDLAIGSTSRNCVDPMLLSRMK